MNVAVITGSGGLIGSEAVRFFASKGFKVIGIDNDLRRTFFGPEASTGWNVERLKETIPGYVHIDGDIRDVPVIERVFTDYGADIRLVVHAAAQPSHDWAARAPFVDFSINANGTLNLLEMTRLYAPEAVFIFTSTNKVYGETPNTLPLIERETRWEIDPAHPFSARGIDESMSIDQTKHSLLGASKLAADVLVQEYGRYFGMKTACFRGGCLTGPNHSGTELHGFLSYLVKCAVTGAPYTVFGYKGKQVRDNIHSYDLVNMFWHFYQNPRSGEVYNAGGGRHSHCSMLEAFAMVKEITGKDVRRTYTETNRIGDHIWWVSDTAKFQRHYPEWQYTYDIRQIMEEIVNEMDKRVGKEAAASEIAPRITVRFVDRWQEMKETFGFARDGVLLEPDIDTVENDCELFSRKRRDAEVLTMIAANCSGNALDIGTSHGRSAYKLATNIPGHNTVYTVNILPEQMDATSGKMITHLLTKEDIGSYYRQFNLDNITQLYANTGTWDMPPEIEGLGMVFVDGAHDTDLVYSDSKKAYACLADGGFMLWHDFSPALRQQFDWIDACMRGVERFCTELGSPVEIVHLRNSWIGVLRKKSAVSTGIVVTNREENPAIAIDRMKALKFVIAYPSYSTARQEEEERLIGHLRGFGYDVEGFPIPCPEGWWPFERLDKAWRENDPLLMKPYASLHLLMEAKDVLISAGGSMLHPGFLRSLKAVTVSVAADDPESSDILTRPVIPAFDLALTVNPGCVEMYRSWGARRAGWIFSPVLPEMLDPSVSERSILDGNRNVDIIFLGAKVTPVEDRAVRLADLLRRFPQAVLGGPEWPLGSLDPSLWYPRTKIGWNFTNNTVGPNNTRTWHLPALGVMQICDNKSQLGKVFTLDREVVGYDTLQECSDKTRYYLDHDSERREIARNGWKRATTEYTLDRWWQALLNEMEPVCFPDTSISQTPELCEIPANGSRPRVAMLVDRPGWAYDHVAKAVSARLAVEFEFRIFYVIDRPDLSSWDFDLLYVFFWGETYHQSFGIDPQKIIKEVSSHRWALEDAYGKLDAKAMCARYLADAGSLTATSVRLQELIAPFREILLVPNGIDERTFLTQGKRAGPLVIGWAGNANDPCKGVSDILVPAAGTEFTLRIAGGDLNHDRMREFYNSIDILCVASTAEGSPLTLLEAMACGCFPVCVDVGIVPEVVRHGENGLIVERSVAAFRAAFQWCAANTEFIRVAGSANATAIRQQRNWDMVAPAWRHALRAALGKTKYRIWHNQAAKAVEPVPQELAS